MGVDIHIHLVKFCHEDRYFHELKLYRVDQKTGGFKEVDLYPYRNSEMFDDMQGEEFPSTAINLSSLAPDIREDIECAKNSVGCYDFYCINLASFALYIEKNPIVKDYDADWGEDGEDVKYKPNPLKDLYLEICTFLSFADFDYDWTPLSDYSMLFYFDH